MNRKIFNFFVLLFFSSFFYACSSEPIKPDPGRCFIHADCAPGMECVNTRCQDLYHPENKIRQR